VLSELLRIADRAIVSFPNFGHWRVRWSLMARGRMPETRALPEPWWSTPNIHLCSLADFNALTSDLDLRTEHCAALARGQPARPIDPSSRLENWRAENALFLLSRRTPDPDPEPSDRPRDLFEA
jgi:methionine biosynthesis protein MetW